MTSTPVSLQDAGVVASASTGCRFPSAARVRAKAEFARVFEAGNRRTDPLLALHWLADEAPARFGLAVSRKVDSRAVGRNRIKRVLRESFRQMRPQLKGGAYVVVARAAAAKADGPALRAAFLGVLQRIDALPVSSVAGTMRAASAQARTTPSSSEPRSD